MIVTNPLNAGAISFILRRIRCIVISPRRSPRYAFAETVVSGIDPISLPVPSMHSKMKSVEHSFGYNSRIVDCRLIGSIPSDLLYA